MKALKVLTTTAALGALLATPALADVSTDIYYNGELLNTTQPVMNMAGCCWHSAIYLKIWRDR